MEEEKKEIKKSVTENLKCKIEKALGNYAEEDLQANDIQMIGELVDIYKDLENVKYWEIKEDVMMNREYGNYDGEYGHYYPIYEGGRSRDSRGRYMGDYGRRYRGDEMLDSMHNSYRNYNGGRESYRAGNYNAKNETMDSLDKMLRSTVDFIQMLKQDAQSEDEIRLIQQYTRKISEM